MKKQSSTPRHDHAEGLDDTLQQADKKRNVSHSSNAPWTTTGKITSPKFGAAGSGGAEYEPGPEGD